LSDSSRRLLRNGSVYTFASVASTVTALLVTPLLTRTLGLAEYDKVAVAVVVLNATINLMSLGLPTAIIRAVHSDTDGRSVARRIAVTGFVVVLATAVAAGVIAGLSGWGSEIAVALVAGGAGGAVAMVLAFQVATERPRGYVLISFGTSLGGPLVGLLSALVLGSHAINYVGGLAATYVLVAVIGAVLLALPGSMRFSRREFTRALYIGLPMVPHQLAVGTAAGAAVLLAALLLPEGSAAHVQLALLIGSAPLAIVSALSSAWTPVVLSAAPEERGAHLEETSGVIAGLAALGGGALSLLSPWFILILAPGEQFDTDSMIPVVAISTVAATLAVAYTSHLQIVIASGKTMAMVILSPLALVLGFAVGALTVPWVGLLGASLGFVAVYVFFVVFTRALARSASPIRWSERSLGAAVLLSAGIATLGAVLPWDSLPFSILRIGAAALLLVGAMVIFLRKIRSAR
jgi:O-antigen/teichoic acid export membrane protein